MTWEALRFTLKTAVPSTRFDDAYPGFIRELEYFMAVLRASEAGYLLRDIRQQPYFEQIDMLANAIHPAVFAELRKCARSVSFPKIVRKRSAEFFRILFAVRQDLLRLYAFERKQTPVASLQKHDAYRIRCEIEWSIAQLAVAGARFRLGYPVNEESLNRMVKNLDSVLTARIDALAPGWS